MFSPPERMVLSAQLLEGIWLLLAAPLGARSDSQRLDATTSPGAMAQGGSFLAFPGHCFPYCRPLALLHATPSAPSPAGHTGHLLRGKCVLWLPISRENAGFMQQMGFQLNLSKRSSSWQPPHLQRPLSVRHCTCATESA